MATRSSGLAWRIPGTEEPGGLTSMGSHRVRHDWSDLANVLAWQELRKWEVSYHSSLACFTRLHTHWPLLFAEDRKIISAYSLSLVALLLLSHFSRVRLCVTPEMAAHQAPPSLGFSRQKHWSGLPFPSPMHESKKWKWSRSVMSDSSDPMDCSLPGSSVHGIF